MAIPFAWITIRCLVFSTLLFVCAQAQNVAELESELRAAGIPAEFPDTDNWVNASMPFNRRFMGIKPFGVAYPTGPKAVSVALTAATKQGVKVTARSGGHSYTAGGLGTTDGHFVIDMTKNNEMSYDSRTGIATVGTGNRLGMVALFLNEKGRAMPHGRCSFVGVGGHSGHGGWGHHSRMWGLFADVVREATVVTADGKIHTASLTRNPELFWAIRGASSSFGIVTQVKVQTFPQPPEASIFHYIWPSLPVSEATKRLSAFQDFTMRHISSRFGGEIVFKKGEAKGEVLVELFGGYWGPHAFLERTLAPYLKQFPTAPEISITQGTYFEGLESWVYLPLNTTDKPNSPDNFYTKSVLTPERELLSEKSIENFVSYLANEGFTTEMGWFVEVELYGGRGSVINAVPQYATAFAHRDSLFTFQMYASGELEKPYPTAGHTFINGMADSLTRDESKSWPWSSYVGYPDEDLENWQSRYFKNHYSLLQKLKSKYDPQNTFSFPLSIEPLH